MVQGMFQRCRNGTVPLKHGLPRAHLHAYRSAFMLPVCSFLYRTQCARRSETASSFSKFAKHARSSIMKLSNGAAGCTHGHSGSWTESV